MFTYELSRWQNSAIRYVVKSTLQSCVGGEEGSYLRLIDFISLNSRLESNKEEEEEEKR